MISGSQALDYFLAYQFLKRLVLKFSEWPAFKTGVIDAQGAVIVPPELRTQAQKDSYGPYDVMVSNLKKLLARLPGGSTRLASLISAAFLMREHANDFTEEQFIEYYNRMITEEAPANAVGGGNVAGCGVGPQGEPGGKAAILKKMMKRKKLDVDSTTAS